MFGVYFTLQEDEKKYILYHDPREKLMNDSLKSVPKLDILQNWSSEKKYILYHDP